MQVGARLFQFLNGALEFVGIEPVPLVNEHAALVQKHEGVPTHVELLGTRGEYRCSAGRHAKHVTRHVAVVKELLAYIQGRANVAAV